MAQCKVLVWWLWSPVGSLHPPQLLTVGTSALSGIVFNQVMKHRKDQKARVQPPLPYKFRQRQSGLEHFGKDQLPCLAGRRILAQVYQGVCLLGCGGYLIELNLYTWSTLSLFFSWIILLSKSDLWNVAASVYVILFNPFCILLIFFS